MGAGELSRGRARRCAGTALGTLLAALTLSLASAAPASAICLRVLGRDICTTRQPPPPPPPPGPPELLPNLQTQRPFDITAVTVDGERRLELSNQVANAGNGVLEVYPLGSVDCNGNGSPDDDRAAYQRIYQDSNRDGVFERGTDSPSRSVYAGCMFFHPAHNHWHFENFARYQLKRVVTGAVVSSADKVSFCIADSDQLYPDLPGSPSSSYYQTGCGQDATQGLSVGWSDIYHYNRAGQYIVITGVPDGDYCLVSTADPANRLIESANDDNAAGVRLALRSGSPTVSSQTCS